MNPLSKDERAARGQRARRDVLQRLLALRRQLQQGARHVPAHAQDHGDRRRREVRRS